MLAPACFTAWAMPVTCSRLSTEQGPAITARRLPPTGTPATSTTVSSGWNMRLAFLKGSATCMMRSTQGKLSMRLGSTWEVSPTRPRMVSSVPITGFTCTPWAVTRLVSLSISCWVAPFFNTIIIACQTPFPAGNGRKKGRARKELSRKQPVSASTNTVRGLRPQGSVRVIRSRKIRSR